MITSILKKIAVGFALASALGTACADLVKPTFFNLGDLTKTLSHSRDDIDSEFHDVLYFKATTLLGATASIVSIDFFEDLNGFYRFGVGSSFDSANWDKSSQRNLESSDIVTDYVQNFPTLQSGETYWLEIYGSMTNGSYSAMIIPSMVPEPGSMALVLAGMGAVGIITRRRKNTASRTGA